MEKDWNCIRASVIELINRFKIVLCKISCLSSMFPETLCSFFLPKGKETKRGNRIYWGMETREGSQIFNGCVVQVFIMVFGKTYRGFHKKKQFLSPFFLLVYTQDCWPKINCFLFYFPPLYYTLDFVLLSLIIFFLY